MLDRIIVNVVETCPIVRFSVDTGVPIIVPYLPPLGVIEQIVSTKIFSPPKILTRWLFDALPTPLA
jgi:hypothetical protein